MATQKLKPHGAELHKNWRDFCVPIKGIGVVWIPEVIRLHHEGHNLCGWLKVEATENCGKSCIGVYCKVYLARIYRKSKIPVPLRSGGKGIQARFISARSVVGKGFVISIKLCRKLPRFSLIKLWPNFWILEHPFRDKLRDWCTHPISWILTLTT